MDTDSDDEETLQLLKDTRDVFALRAEKGDADAIDLVARIDEHLSKKASDDQSPPKP